MFSLFPSLPPPLPVFSSPFSTPHHLSSLSLVQDQEQRPAVGNRDFLTGPLAARGRGQPRVSGAREPWLAAHRKPGPSEPPV